MEHTFAMQSLSLRPLAAPSCVRRPAVATIVPPLRKSSSIGLPMQQKSVAISSVDRHAIATKAAASEAPEGFKWGADMKNLAISIGVGVVFWFLPVPSGKCSQSGIGQDRLGSFGGPQLK